MNRESIAWGTQVDEHDEALHAKKVVGVGGALATEETLAANYATKVTVSGLVTYVGKAAIGSAQASAVWQAKKIDETTGVVITFADGNASFDNVATDLTSLSYS